MPSSEHWQIPRICDELVRTQPRTVLDVGAGWGKFGVLAREYGGATRVDAVDANPPRYPVYDHVGVGDIRRLETLLPPDVPRYDLALFIDVIEHLEKREAMDLLATLARRAGRVLVTTPWGFRRQEVPGMPYETHRSGWYPWDFRGPYVVEKWRAFPGHFTRHLRLPRLWQLLVVLRSEEAPGTGPA